jgi:N-acetylmuramoyl-L-alanine amidase
MEFGAKVLAICGAAAFMCVTISNTHKGAVIDAAERSAIHVAVIQETEVSPETETEETETEEPYQSSAFSKDWDGDEAYLLAKIAMAETEGEDTEGKALVMLVVLNRTYSNEFPDSIEEVILQEGQFSPVSNGRFEKVEPDQDCWDALELVESGWDESDGALYFESKSDSEWHRKNLSFLFQHGKHYFYTDKEG